MDKPDISKEELMQWLAFMANNTRKGKPERVQSPERKILLFAKPDQLVCPIACFEGEDVTQLQALTEVSEQTAPRITEYSHLFKLHPPQMPSVRDIVWKHWLVNDILVNQVNYFFYPHELLILAFTATSEDKCVHLLRFPCCTCGGDAQYEELPAIIYYGWKHGTIDGILKNMKRTSPYHLVTIAACSYLLPRSIYDELCQRLEEVNSALRLFHTAMLIRQTEKHEIDCCAEGAVIAMLEEVYRYTHHSSSIGTAYLEKPDAPHPQFVI